MKRIFLIALTWGMISLLFHSVHQVEATSVYQESYQKALVIDDVLYMMTRKSSEPGFHRNVLLQTALSGQTTARHTALQTGVRFRESWVKDRDNPVALARRYPLRWDIAGEALFSVDVGESVMKDVPGFRLMTIPRQQLELTNESRNASETWVPVNDYGLFQLFHLLTEKKSKKLQKRTVYFDIAVLGSHAFELYVVSDGLLRMWRFDKDSTSSVKTGAFEYHDGEYRDVRVIGWEEHGPWEFDSPFRALRVGGQTYIFSQTNGKLYLPKNEKLEVVAEVPGYFVHSVTGPTIIIMDKDNDSLWFYAPGREFFTPLSPPHALRSKVQQEHLLRIEQAILSLLDWTPDSGAEE